MNRFASMIGLMNSAIKTGLISCEVPTNKLGINVLSILRQQGYIYGFSEVSPRKKEARLYPRVCIYFKYTDINMPVLKAIKIFKNTRSNYYLIRRRNLMRVLVQHRLYILSSTQGLTLTSSQEFYRNNSNSSIKLHLTGKMLVEVLI